MSYCIDIHTKESLNLDSLWKSLEGKDLKIVITSEDWPSVKFGCLGEAIRGIEVNKEDYGYEIRVCSMASKSDYQLFVTTVEIVADMTDGMVFAEGDDEADIRETLREIYNEDWINRQRTSIYEMLRAMYRTYGSNFVMFGMFTPFSFGPRMFAGFGLDLYSNDDISIEDVDKVEDYLAWMQWWAANKEGTSSRLAIKGDNDVNYDISAVMISEDGELDSFDYITNASLFGIFDLANKDKEPVLIRFEDVNKVVNKEKFQILDEHSYRRTGDVTTEDIRAMAEIAQRYVPEDVCARPSYPGEGKSEDVRTFILMWNPSISSMTQEGFDDDIPYMLIADFNWSVWEHDKAQMGDRFYLIRCGQEKNNGIVMSGVFGSNPYPGEDWSGKGRTTFYMDLDPNAMVKSSSFPMIPTWRLKEEIPDFNWDGGHSGRILSKEDANRLEKIWAKYLSRHSDEVDGEKFNYKKSQD